MVVVTVYVKPMGKERELSGSWSEVKEGEKRMEKYSKAMAGVGRKVGDLGCAEDGCLVWLRCAETAFVGFHRHLKVRTGTQV